MDAEREQSLPPETVIIDGGGRFAIPGLFDVHVHTEVSGAYQEALLAYGRYVGARCRCAAALARGPGRPWR